MYALQWQSFPKAWNEQAAMVIIFPFLAFNIG
jgi:hypothetical protein